MGSGNASTGVGSVSDLRVLRGLSFYTDFTDVQAVGMVGHLGTQEQVVQQDLPKTT